MQQITLVFTAFTPSPLVKSIFNCEYPFNSSSVFSFAANTGLRFRRPSFRASFSRWISSRAKRSSSASSSALEKKTFEVENHIAFHCWNDEKDGCSYIRFSSRICSLYSLMPLNKFLIARGVFHTPRTIWNGSVSFTLGVGIWFRISSMFTADLFFFCSFRSLEPKSDSCK